MKKILFAMMNMNIGGTEKAFLNMADTMPANEYNITLKLLEKKGGFMDLLPSHVNVEVIDGYDRMKAEIMDPPLRVAGHYFKSGKIWDGLAVASTHLWFKLTGDRTPYFRYVLRGKKCKEKYDTAIAYAGPFDFLTVYVLYCVQAKTKVQWIHFDVSKFHFNKKQYKKWYPRFDQICVVSDEARRELVKQIPAIRAKTKTYLNTVSAQKCREMADMGDGFEDQWWGIRIVTVGRLAQEKGQDIVPEIAAKLKSKGLRFRWYLIGDGKLRQVIEESIKKFGVEENVVLLGTKSNPYTYLREADLYVQTSVHEGYCITLAEACVFDLPIVSTEFAGAHEQLDGRENSYIVRRDADSITEAILRLKRDK